MSQYSKVVRGVAAVPIGGDLPFVLSAQDTNLTPLQSSILASLEVNIFIQNWNLFKWFREMFLRLQLEQDGFTSYELLTSVYVGPLTTY